MPPRKKCGEMRLDQALGLYIGLYVVAFLTSWFVSIPMLIHVSRNHECLLFVPPAIEYGPALSCFTVGLLPLFSGFFIFILIILHIWQLQSLKRYLRNPDIPHSSKDYHNRPTHIFWRMVVFHGVVTLMMLITVAVLTSGYATTCQNVTRDVSIKVRARFNKDSFGGGNLAGYGQSNYETRERYADQNSLEKYSNPYSTNVYGQNRFEQAITCRAVLTDIEYTKIFKSKHESNLLYRQYYTPNQQFQPVADFGNLRYFTYRDNLILELSMAGSWICFLVLAVIMVLMTTQRHHLRAHIRDESMWGGSEYGRGARSVSRFSNHSFDRGSQYSHQSGSRYSASRSGGGGGGGRRSRAPSEQPHNYSANNSSYRQQNNGGTARGQMPLPSRPQPNNISSSEQPQPNGLMSYFAENPPVDEEVDIDAALNDQSLDDMMEHQPDNLDGSGGPMPIKEPGDTSFGSEGLPVPGLDQTFGDPIPLGDEVSSGQMGGHQQQYPVQPRDPNRVTGRRGGRQSTAASRSPPQQTASYTQEIRQSTHEKYEYRSPAPVGQQHDMSYRTHLGNQSMI